MAPGRQPGSGRKTRESRASRPCRTGRIPQTCEMRPEVSGRNQKSLMPHAYLHYAAELALRECQLAKNRPILARFWKVRSRKCIFFQKMRALLYKPLTNLPLLVGEGRGEGGASLKSPACPSGEITFLQRANWHRRDLELPIQRRGNGQVVRQQQARNSAGQLARRDGEHEIWLNTPVGCWATPASVQPRATCTSTNASLRTRRISWNNG